MKTLLVTGFDPFGGETVNPAWEAVKRLPEGIGLWRIHRLMVPTVFGLAYETAAAEAEHARALAAWRKKTEKNTEFFKFRCFK